MNVAVVGAGIVGLATAYNLLQKGHSVTIFAPNIPSASSVSTGLLHPYPGKKALKSWEADQGMHETRLLLDVAEHALGKPVANYNGIERFSPDMWIPEGITVFSEAYLQGLRLACQDAQFIDQKISSLDELDHYDRIILATGDQSLQFAELPLRRVIGQALLCQSDRHLNHSQIYPGYHISVTEDPTLYLVGSTYEYTPEPNPEKALKLVQHLPDFKVLEIRAATRIAPKVGYRPISHQLNTKTWILTGFGSRGLLYHAMFAKHLVQNLML
jgi:glycine/D-amino acid oxidase-like deaminating enzyme